MQTNAAATSVSSLTGMPEYAIGIIMAGLTALIITGGAGRISALTVKLIPVVSAAYILMCAAVIIGGIDMVPEIFADIIDKAFSLRPAVSGAGGFMITRAIRYGVTRGVLTNEAGSGTSPAAHACAEASSAMSQGTLGIFEVFADTIVICTLTAFTVLIAGDGIFSGTDAASASIQAFSVLGDWSTAALAVIMLVFVFATLIAQFYYGESALRFICDTKRARYVYIAVFSLCVLIGSVITPQLMWLLTDITVALMTTVNVICLLFMKRQVIDCTDLGFSSREIHIQR